jgi:hypothetical protein
MATPIPSTLPHTHAHAHAQLVATRTHSPYLITWTRPHSPLPHARIPPSPSRQRLELVATHPAFLWLHPRAHSQTHSGCCGHTHAATHFHVNVLSSCPPALCLLGPTPIPPLSFGPWAHTPMPPRRSHTHPACGRTHPPPSLSRRRLVAPLSTPITLDRVATHPPPSHPYPTDAATLTHSAHGHTT